MTNTFSVRRYQQKDFNNWNAFIAKAKNATFLFHRDFMEYHKDRFQDHSLIVLQNEKWVAVLPANVVDSTVYSHQGLTYGGLVYNEKLKLASVIEVFKCVLFFLNDRKIRKLQLKLLPYIYCHKPADELNYALFLSDAQLIRRDTLTVIDLSKKIVMASGRKDGIIKGKKNQLQLKEVDDFDLFWNTILIPNLADRHRAKPVHTLQEITKLKSFFPNQIRQFNVYENETIVGGTTIFETENVAHCQYISGKVGKNELGGLDLLIHHLIKVVFKEKHFFDFGISNENQGRTLNNGLSYWKESFGASTVVQDFYEVETANFNALDTILK